MQKLALRSQVELTVKVVVELVVLVVLSYHAEVRCRGVTRLRLTLVLKRRKRNEGRDELWFQLIFSIM